MKDIETIRKELKQVRYYFAVYDLFANRAGTRLMPPDYIIKMVNDYNERIYTAPIRLRIAFDHLYRLHKTQKIYAQECGVTEKYIQILHKRIVNFFYDSFNKEQN